MRRGVSASRIRRQSSVQGPKTSVRQRRGGDAGCHSACPARHQLRGRIVSGRGRDDGHTLCGLQRAGLGQRNGQDHDEDDPRAERHPRGGVRVVLGQGVVRPPRRGRRACGTNIAIPDDRKTRRLGIERGHHGRARPRAADRGRGERRELFEAHNRGTSGRAAQGDKLLRIGRLLRVRGFGVRGARTKRRDTELCR